jgi:menaquinone-specific isochorismate synthase
MSRSAPLPFTIHKSPLDIPTPFAAWERLAAEFDAAFLWKGRDDDQIWMGFGQSAEYVSLTDCRQALHSARGDVGNGLEARCFCTVAFDPSQKPSELWRDFSPRKYLLPEILLRWREGEATLLTPSSSPASLISQIANSNRNLAPMCRAHVVDGGRLFSRSRWIEAVEAIRAEIREDMVNKVVLARDTWREAGDAINAGLILDHLAGRAPDTFLFAQKSRESIFLGASPEKLFSLKAARLEVDSLAGTRPRGRTPAEDERLAQELLDSTKERAEHELVTDFLVQRMTRLCRHTLWERVPHLRKLATVQHLFTPISSEVHEAVSLDDILTSLHPTPAVCGSPREAAAELIRKLEPEPRGLYAGAVGWIDSQSAEFAVGIRSALIKGRKATLFAGAGIVEGSDPDSEWNETALKMKPMLAALDCESA